MADEKKDETAAGNPKDMPGKTDQKSINEDYAKASVKDKLKKFKVDPVTKTLRRA